MLQKTEMVRRGFVNLRTSCYRSSGGPVLLKKCHGRTDFRTGPKVHATLFNDEFETKKINRLNYKKVVDFLCIIRCLKVIVAMCTV